MIFAYKNTEAALHAYTTSLNGLKLGQNFFSQINLEYSSLLTELFKRLFETNSLDRQEEFLNDFKLFIDDMMRKYSTTSPYGYSPRSPYEKRMGLNPRSSRAKNITGSNDYDNYHGLIL